MQTALDLWPACFWGFWAYPFLGIVYWRHHRFIRELAAIGTGQRAADLSFNEAVQMLTAFQHELVAEIEAAKAPNPHTPASGALKIEEADRGLR